MASSISHLEVPGPTHEGEILTDDQIDILLTQAEARLREKAGLEVITAGNGTVTKYTPIPKLRPGLERLLSVKDQSGVVVVTSQPSVDQTQESMANALRQIEPSQSAKRINDVTAAGSQWYNLPKTELTPQLKRDLQIIELRNVLDPHRHYKKNTRKGKIPAFSQIGTVVEGPTEFFSGRINKKDRSKNFVEEAMKVEAENGRFKRKYNEIQDSKTSGKKAHYKKLMAKRKKS